MHLEEKDCGERGNGSLEIVGRLLQHVDLEGDGFVEQQVRIVHAFVEDFMQQQADFGGWQFSCFRVGQAVERDGRLWASAASLCCCARRRCRHRCRCFGSPSLLCNLLPVRWRWVCTHGTLLAASFTGGQFSATFELLLSTSQTGDNRPWPMSVSLSLLHDGVDLRRTRKQMAR